MKTVIVKTKLFQFDELSEQGKENAVNNLSDINTDYEWWDFIYYDAKTVGLVLDTFDLDRNKHCKGLFENSGTECARLIMQEHGEKTETHLLAFNFIADWDRLVEKHSDGEQTDRVAEYNEVTFDDEADELEKEFLRALLEEYANMLQRQYDYLISDKAIIEAIKANEYWFTVGGKLSNL